MAAQYAVHYHIGRNLPGYLPESDVTCVLAWDDAVTILAAEMRDYADTDDDVAWDSLSMVPADDYPRQEDGSPDYGDDAPSMRATVDAILTDDGPREDDARTGWNAYVDDNDDRTIAFWVALVPAGDCDRTEDDGDDAITL